MSASYRLAIDAMGGDFGPRVAVAAACRALDRHPDLALTLVGDQAQLKRLLRFRRRFGDRLHVLHAPDVVAMDDKPAHALRRKRDSSMWHAVRLVAEQQVDGCVSGGNTGALMVIGRRLLGTFDGIDRPAIISAIPTRQAHCYLLDSGANVDCTAQQLLQFAVMGSVYAAAIDRRERPSVALLNIGHEAGKGNDTVKQAAELMAQQRWLNFAGYVEGNTLYHGEADVVVCDGFVGNVALKAGEGVAGLITHRLKQIFRRNWYAKVMLALAWPLLRQLRTQIDPGRYNGAGFLGLRGIVIKSHGGATTASFVKAIERARDAVQQQVPARIQQQLQQLPFATDVAPNTSIDQGEST